MKVGALRRALLTADAGGHGGRLGEGVFGLVATGAGERVIRGQARVVEEPATETHAGRRWRLRVLEEHLHAQRGWRRRLDRVLPLPRRTCGRRVGLSRSTRGHDGRQHRHAQTPVPPCSPAHRDVEPRSPDESSSIVQCAPCAHFLTSSSSSVWLSRRIQHTSRPSPAAPPERSSCAPPTRSAVRFASWRSRR